MQTETYLMQEKVRLIFARLFVLTAPYAYVSGNLDVLLCADRGGIRFPAPQDAPQDQEPH